MNELLTGANIQKGGLLISCYGFIWEVVHKFSNSFLLILCKEIHEKALALMEEDGCYKNFRVIRKKGKE